MPADLAPDAPRAYTQDEVVEIMMAKFRQLAKYWAEVKLDPEQDNLLWRCEGVAFSLLAELDGSGLDFPAVDLVLCPHESDEDYHKSNGENWFEPEMRISTALHEHFHIKTANK